MKEVSLLYCLPDNPFFSAADKSPHAVQDAAYACAYALHFCCHYIFEGDGRLWLDLRAALLQPPRRFVSCTKERP
jgi:hypothetical protein